MNSINETKGKTLWVFPWGYREGVLFAIGFQLVGFLLEQVFPLRYYAPPKFPLNGAYILLLIVLSVFGRIFWNKKQLVIWLSSIKASIPAMLMFSFNVLLLATIPQQQTKLPVGLHHIVRTWYFAFATAFILISLSFTISKRIIPLSFKSIAFTITHIGLWLSIAAGLLGSGDKVEVKVQVAREQLVWYGIDKKGNSVDLPIALRLKGFVADFYPPKPALLIDRGESTIFPSSSTDISVSKSFKIGQYDITVLNYYSKAYPSDSGFVEAKGVPFTVPAALVKVKGSNGENITGWISPQGLSFAERSISITPNMHLVLLPPEPKYFASDISLFTKSGISDQKHRIEVNSPLKVDGWHIYQYGYDSRAGADSDYSIFLFVRDPWLPFVNSGMLLLLLGAAMMSFLFIPRFIKN